MNALTQRPATLQLSELLRAAVPELPLPAALAGRDPEVTGLTVDSGSVQPGWIFAACQGARSHGLAYLNAALANGAGAVLWEPGGDVDIALASRQCDAAGLPLVELPGLGRKLGPLAATLYGNPSDALTVVGVTGTDGKTSVSQFLAQALAADAAAGKAGKPVCGLVGTLGYGLHGRLETASHTTPDAPRVQQLLAGFRDAGASHVSMEVSSHALDQGRVEGVRFHTAVLTNLGRDHLDYHKTETAYAAAKQRLFMTAGLRCAVLNLDDGLGHSLQRKLAGDVRVLGYSMEPETGADISLTGIDLGTRGMTITALTPVGVVEATVPVMGRFNAQNLLALIGVLQSLDWDAARISRALGGVTAVPGRMECFGNVGGPLVVVDYAHTGGALEAALRALSEHVPGRIWCVFGCGGERDSGKRPLMAAAAETHAFRVIITDDNPRGEDPEAIVAGIQAGFRRGPAPVERDRVRAIDLAIRDAGPGDAVLVAGKGHEDYQITAHGRHYYSDRDAVAALLAEVRS